ncbi:hypothetical protein FRB91_001961 [Serendipita sp. 411]|nr:hypothetical protein FRC18_002090 [Serendipita sp. 400]KAG8855581.1 hypothetical protein FRB91_001961 [Serendipita sp. 411]
MIASSTGSHSSYRVHYILALTLAITILLIIHSSTTRSTATVTPADIDETFKLQSMECRIRAQEAVMALGIHNSTVASPNNGDSTNPVDAEGKIVTSPLSFYENPFAASTDPSRRAYATTLYGDKYLPGALLLGYSLRKHGMLHPDIAQHMVLLHIPGRLSSESLEMLRSVGWETVEVEKIPIPNGKPPNPSYNDQYTKLRLFELDHFDQIFYIDSDALVVKSFPEIWSFPAPFAACRDIRIGTDTIWLPTINAGTLLAKPNRRLLEHMLKAAPGMVYEHWFAEQGLLNEYWQRDLTFYPYIFNGQLDLKRGFPAIWKEFRHDMRVIHYTWTKPWECEHKLDQPDERRVWLKEWDEMIEVRSRQGLSLAPHLQHLTTTKFCATQAS